MEVIHRLEQENVHQQIARMVQTVLEKPQRIKIVVKTAAQVE